ncbi:DNA-binding protein [Arthrobacter crystallopoietes BAB-32]|uniref:DNA-binding protein n=1 Tax=Arthrobacter crystallopoietes BAB-32 TaxID=1246476 RepID=N1V060_9MICC|nr:substrate-binding domain-containing protein [Arthrobacter crystallopoietes]EMY33414.1 DNA-binding protein [Arthrobacter crystallopoietes BAB-32]
MAHQFTVREIAQQAGVSDATVDRVLHGRPGVRPSTAGQVRRAMQELEAQRHQLELTGRRFLIDVVTDAPARFNNAVRAALEHELPLLRPAVFRARFHQHERWTAGECVVELDRIASLGSHGVILKAPDAPEMAAAVDRLLARGVPVVTLATDVPVSRRLAYVGIDNRSAGATAAYLISQWLGSRPGGVAVTVSNDSFRGEEEREMGFRAAMRRLDPDRPVSYLGGSDGLDDSARTIMAAALAADPALAGVYSIGGGNRGLLAAFEEAGREPAVFVGHDLNPDNVALLRAGRINALLHHDLHQDLNRCCRILMCHHGALPEVPATEESKIDVVTPHNIPAGL